MISYDLICGNGHGFEGWFANSNAYGEQQGKRLIQCPVCDDRHIHKALSPPNVGRKGNQLPAVVATTQAVEPVAADFSTARHVISNAPHIPEALQPVIEKLAEMQSTLLKESTWVGPQFAEEVRAIHYGEADDRLIHGETSNEEAISLIEEGITIAPLPFPVLPPELKN
jgi:hypothetical protein